MKTVITTAVSCFIAGALASFVWSTSHHSETIGELRGTISLQSKTVEGLNEDVRELRATIKENNDRIEEERRAFDDAKKIAEAALLELEKTNSERWLRIKELERMKVPLVDISGMTKEQIVVEISDCRLAVEINNGF